MVVKSRTSVKTTVICLLAKLGRDGIVDDPPHDLLGNKAREGPNSALREIDRGAEFIDFLEVGRDGRRVRWSQHLQLRRLARYLFQGMRHSAAEYPDDRNKGGASNDREDQPGELEFSNALDEVIWVCE